jgi:beta-glucosidase
MLLGNYNGIPADPVTPLRGIREAVGPKTRVLYARGSDLAENFPVYELVPSTVLRTGDGVVGLRAEYYATRDFAGSPRFTTTDSTLNADWRDKAPRADMDPDNFGVRWTGELRPAHTGMYRLGLIGTIKFQMWLDDSLIVRSVYPTHDGEFPDPRQAQSEPIRLEAGRAYRLRVEGQESYGEAQLQLLWAPPNEALLSDALKVASEADVVVMFAGLTARLEGEEMAIQIPGFRGGDRTQIDLPAPQQQLLEKIAGLGKPTVLVLMSGSAVAVNWAQANVPAIVEAWYPGQAAGNAVADVLFGDYNPAGRLPVTFYKSVDDLPAFDDYKMAGRTYRFFSKAPLYPFGHGLSYTSFSYSNIRLSNGRAASKDTVLVSVDVSNGGGRAGDEVIQLYVQHLGSAVPRPIKDLRGYARVHLEPGQRRTVTLPVAVASLAYWNESTHAWTVEREEVRFLVGASSADIRQQATLSVVP